MRQAPWFIKTDAHNLLSRNQWGDDVKRKLSPAKEAEIIGHSTMLFFTIFILINALPDDDFKHKARPLLLGFMVTRVILKFGIFIPYREYLAAQKEA